MTEHCLCSIHALAATEETANDSSDLLVGYIPAYNYYFRAGVPTLSLAVYLFSISIDEHATLKFLMTKSLRKITKIYLPASIQ